MPPPEAAQELPSRTAAAKPSDALISPRGPLPQQAGAADSIREEAHRVSESRSLVRSGKGVQALRKLAELDVAFPRGVLRQERDALRIDALFLAGQKLEARKLVRQFSLRYPESPLVARWASRAE